MKKKIMSVCIAAALMALSASAFAANVSVTAPVETNPFEDTYGKWYENSVAYVHTYGIINGVSSTEFAPDKNVSRAELASILYRISEKEKNGTVDIAEPGQEWYAPAQKWAEDNKIMEGIVIDNNFDADKALKREEIMVMLYNAYKINHTAEDSSDMILSRFTDIEKVSDYAKPAARWTVENQIIQGDDKQNLNPQSNVTRAETAAIIERFLKNCDFAFNSTDGPGMANPVVEYKTLEEAQKASGLTMPEIKDTKLKVTGYYTIAETDSINAVLGEKGTYNGKNIDIRTGSGDRPISGIYGAEALDGGLDGVSVLYQKYNNTVFAEWAVTKTDKIHCYSVAIEGGTADELNSIVKEIGAETLINPEISVSNPVVEYKTLAGAQKASGLTMPEVKDFKAVKYYTISEEDKNEAVLGAAGTYNGKTTEIRTGLGDRDISGVYGEAVDEAPDGLNVVYKKYDKLICADWAKPVGDKVCCYSVAIENGTIDELNTIVNAIGALEVVKETK